MSILIGTSGWHYDDWTGMFYPPDITGYNELTFYSQTFSTVENNSSFYRIAGESTYKTWNRMTPDDFTFSIKLNRFITHDNRLELTNEVQDKIHAILNTTQILGAKRGAILIQLPASFTYNLERLVLFFDYFTHAVRSQDHAFDIAIEFRNKYWFSDEVYRVLKKYNVALVAAQSSRYPLSRKLTADVAYIRMHGPDKLFASSYSDEDLKEWVSYIKTIENKVKRTYVYFNNDFYGYALKNAQKLQSYLSA